MNKKSFKSGLFVLLLLLCMVWIPERAHGAGSITVSGGSASQGGTVMLQVGLNGNPGLSTLELDVSFDSSRLEFTGSKSTGNLPGGEQVKTAHMVFIIPDESGSTANGTIANVSFKVKDNAPLGDAVVTVTCALAVDPALNPLTFSAGSGAVHVGCSHTFGNWTMIQAPSCETAGTQTRTCTKCGAVETAAMAPLGHQYGSYHVIKAATETEKGLQEKQCSRCGKKVQETIPKKKPAATTAAPTSSEPETEESTQAEEPSSETGEAKSTEAESSAAASTQEVSTAEIRTTVPGSEDEGETTVLTEEPSAEPLPEKRSLIAFMESMLSEEEKPHAVYILALYGVSILAGILAVLAAVLIICLVKKNRALAALQKEGKEDFILTVDDLAKATAKEQETLKNEEETVENGDSGEGETAEGAKPPENDEIDAEDEKKNS